MARFSPSLFLAQTAFLLVAIANPAYAVGKFYKPYVHKGEAELEYFGSHSVDGDHTEDGEQKHKIALGYGVTDFWKTELYAIFEKEAEDKTRFDAWEWENIFQLTTPGKYWADVGASLAYEWTPQGGHADAIEARLLFAKEIGHSFHVLNLIAEKAVGEGSHGDVEGGLIWSSRYECTEQFQPGFEIQSAFGELSHTGSFDDQEHYIGPVVYGELPLPFADGDEDEGLGYRVGYLFGVSDAATDGQIVLQLEYGIEF